MTAPPVPDRGGELDALAVELRRVVTLADPVPDGWRAAAGAAFSWARIDATAAHLVYDSLALPGAPAGAPQGAGATRRTLRYAAGPSGVELELDVGADKMRVTGRVRPARTVEIVAIWPEGRQAATTDSGGDYRFDELPRRPLCLHVTGDPAVKTGWIVA